MRAMTCPHGITPKKACRECEREYWRRNSARRRAGLPPSRLQPQLCPHGVLGIKNCRTCHNAQVNRSRHAKKREANPDWTPRPQRKCPHIKPPEQRQCLICRNERRREQMANASPEWRARLNARKRAERARRAARLGIVRKSRTMLVTCPCGCNHTFLAT